MLEELSVRNLGVIADLTLVLGPGMTVITGETGAGKTMIVDAIELLVGGRGTAGAVRHGCNEAVVEGRFSVGEERDETVLRRVLPAGGRSRAYINGAMATASALGEVGTGLVDLHGQHEHQSLLTAAAQRAALDAYGGVPVDQLAAKAAMVAGIDSQLASLGGDAMTRAREMDLLRFQVQELERAAVGDPGEDEVLAAEQEALAGASAHRQAAGLAHALLAGDDGAGEKLGRAVSAVEGSGPLAGYESRLRDLAAELDDIAWGLRDASERLEDDPERLAVVVERRQLLVELRRKYGANLEEVMAYEANARRRLQDLEHHEERVANLEAERSRLVASYNVVAARVAAARMAAAPGLAEAVGNRLTNLAMPHARLEITVAGEGPADRVTFQLAANPGEPAAPLAKVASGGELARAMLALRLVLGRHSDTSQGTVKVPRHTPPMEPKGTLVFDEVDAGIGGETALAVGRALWELGRTHQVLVVTHLAQVAAFADQQVQIRKQVRGDRTVAIAEAVTGEDRVTELSRMLSGQPDSAAARRHAEELLATVGGTC